MDYRAAYNIGDPTGKGRVQEVRIVDSIHDGLHVSYWLENGVDWVKEAEVLASCHHIYHWTTPYCGRCRMCGAEALPWTG